MAGTIYLLQKPEGSIGAGDSARRYEVDNVAAALPRAMAAGAKAETEFRTTAWGRIMALADPFGHGICLIEFLRHDYDEIAESSG